MTPVIFGLQGLTLNKNECSFLKEADPAGIILFSRNISNPDQVHGLTDSVRDCLGRDPLVLIDQEGGRVQRLGPPNWREAPPMAFFGKAFEKEPELAEQALYLNTSLIARELKTLGINVDCLPLLDVPAPGADNIIGDRAFSSDPEKVTHLGRIVLKALEDNQVLPVIKHIPGHGRAGVDSHKELPVVDTKLETLEKTDFVPFQALKNSPFAMTAHVVYSDIDPDNPATLSGKIISEVIRGKIGFEGTLISDDINMKALDGSPKDLAEKCLAAGIDLVLHCNGELPEMEAVMGGISKMPDGTNSHIKIALGSQERLYIDERHENLREYQDLEQKLKSI